MLDLAGGEPRKLTSLATGADAFEWIDANRLAAREPRSSRTAAPTTPATRRSWPRRASPRSARAYDDLLFRHWDTLGRRAAQPPPRRCRSTAGPPSTSRPAATTRRPSASAARTGPSRPTAGGLLLAQGPRRTRPGARTPTSSWCRPPAATPKRVSRRAGLRRRLPLQPGREPPRLARAAARGLRGRPLAARGARPHDGARRTLTEAFDRQVESFGLLARLEDDLLHRRGRRPLARLLRAGGGRRGRDRARRAARSATSRSCPTAGRSSRTQVALTHPAEIVRFGADGKGLARVTRVNDALARALRPARRARASATRAPPAKSVQAWVVKPPDFDPAKKYPLLVLVHGGPQGAWTDGWTLPLERAGLRERRLRGLHAQPARLDRLGPGVHRRHQPRLGRQGLRGPDEGDRLRAESLPYVEQGPHRGGRRVLRRLHDQLDRGPHRPLQGARHATTASSTSSRCTARPRSCGSRSGSSAGRTGRTPRATPATTRATS